MPDQLAALDHNAIANPAGVAPSSALPRGNSSGGAVAHNQSSTIPNLTNVPTQYSSSRFGGNNPNSRGGAPPGINNMGGVGNANAPVNFGALSNSSHYARNMSPQPGPHALIASVGGQSNGASQMAPASGGYMGQGLDGMIGRLEPTGSDANSTSFYSNNTSAISHNLSNSRYLLNRRDNKYLGNPTQVGAANSVGKVMPSGSINGMTKSIENPIGNFSGSGPIGAAGYGSRTSNFSNNLSATNNVYQPNHAFNNNQSTID